MNLYRYRFLLVTSLKSVLFLVFFSGLGSCGFFGISDNVPLIWPSGGLPAFGGSEPDAWDLSWLSVDGTVFRRRVVGDERPVISFARELPVIITASPVTPEFPEPFTFKAAGCVRAPDLPRPLELCLKWEEGFAASYLLSLAESGIRPDSVNIRRFLDAVESRSGGNPWNLDLRRLSSELLGGELWIYSFRPLPVLDVTIPLPPGNWYSEYPPEPIIISEVGGWSGGLSTGLHHFIRPFDGLAASVSVDERGDVIVLSGG